MRRKSLFAVAAGLGVTGLAALGLFSGLFQAGTATVTGGETREGIAVHGRWTIEVRDPDGTLVERREFDNALATQAPALLAELAAGSRTSGIWRIDLAGGSGNNPCAGGASPCFIVETAAGGSGSTFPTLTVSVPSSGPNSPKLVLSGTATAQHDSQILLVRTSLGHCDPTVAPSTDCVGSNMSFSPMTAAVLSPAVSVVSGQQIQVTVVITFS